MELLVAGTATVVKGAVLAAMQVEEAALEMGMVAVAMVGTAGQA